MAKEKTRSFDYTKPFIVEDKEFPTTLFSVEDDENNINPMRVGANALGEYFTILDDGKIQPVMLLYYVPEVKVTGSKDKFFKHLMQEARKNWEKDTNDYLTLSNDNTMVNNVPHRTYNLNNYDRGLRGAESYNQRRQEHPHQAMVEDLMAAAPFMLLGGAGLAGLSGTALGTGIGSFMMNPYTQAAIDSYFLANGINSVANGKADWKTALDFVPAAKFVKPTWLAVKGINNTVNNFYKDFYNGLKNYRVGTGVVNTANDVTNTANDIAKAIRNLTITDEALNSSRAAANASREGMQPITGFTPVDTAANTTLRVKPVNTALNANNNLFSSFDKVDDGDDIIEYAEMMDKPPVDTYSNHSLFEGLHPTVQALEDLLKGPFTRHLSRAKAKGYDTSKVLIYDIKDNNPSTQVAIIKILTDTSKKTGIPFEQLCLGVMNKLLKDKGMALTDEGLILYNSNNIDNQAELSAVLSHELEHALHIPGVEIPLDAVDYLDLPKHIENYFDRFKNTELGARFAQVKDWFGHTGNELLTGDDLRKAKELYLSATGYPDNQMTEFFNSIVDFDKAAAWANNKKNVIGIMPLILGSAAYNYNNNSNNNSNEKK